MLCVLMLDSPSGVGEVGWGLQAGLGPPMAAGSQAVLKSPDVSGSPGSAGVPQCQQVLGSQPSKASGQCPSLPLSPLSLQREVLPDHHVRAVQGGAGGALQEEIQGQEQRGGRPRGAQAHRGQVPHHLGGDGECRE